MSNKTEIAFVIVNYNTVDLLRACLESIIEQTKRPYTIIVVDNHSTDGSGAMVQANFPSVQLIQNQENVGYPTAVNQGLRAIAANFYFILNSDILILEDTIEQLYNYHSQHSQTGITAPAQRLPNGKALLSVHQFPTLWREWTRNLFFTDVWRYRLRGQKQAEAITQPVAVEWVTGAALFVRREMIDAIGGMDEAIFMYGEELDWCYRARANGWRVTFLPQAQIIHYVSASADKAFSFHRYAHVVRSNYYFFAKHFGLIWLPLFVLPQLIGSLVRAAISGILCLVGRKSFCYQAREHWLVIQKSLDFSLYKWLRETIQP